MQTKMHYQLVFQGPTFKNRPSSTPKKILEAELQPFLSQNICIDKRGIKIDAQIKAGSKAKDKMNFRPVNLMFFVFETLIEYLPGFSFLYETVFTLACQQSRATQGCKGEHGQNESSTGIIT